MPISSEALEITSSERSTRERPTTSPDGRRGNKPRNGINLKFETMTNCVKAGYKNAKQVALGKRNFCKGFVFKYLD